MWVYFLFKEGVIFFKLKMKHFKFINEGLMKWLSGLQELTQSPCRDGERELTPQNCLLTNTLTPKF